MTILILSSNEDKASINMRNFLLKSLEWDEIGELFSNKVYRCKESDAILVTINDPLIYHEEVDREVIENLGTKIDLIIALSKHKSKSQEPTLTTHPIGNFGKAQFGGKDRTLVKTSPRMMSQFLRILREKAKNLYHKVSFEVTHHGPFVEAGTFFVEVGSDEKEWNNITATNAVADSVKDLILNFRSEDDAPQYPVLVGVGGGHYAPRFSELVFEKKVAFGHMIPSYWVESIDEDILNKCISATPNFKGFYIHRKGLKKSIFREIERKIREIGMDIYRSEDLEDLD